MKTKLIQMILKRIDEGLHQAGVEYHSDARSDQVKILGVKHPALSGDVYTINEADLTVGRALSFLAWSDSLTFWLDEREFASCVPGKTVAQCDAFHLNAPELIDRVVMYLATGEILPVDPAHHWIKRSGDIATCTTCGIDNTFPELFAKNKIGRSGWPSPSDN